MAKQIPGLPEIMTTKEQSVQSCIKLADMYTLRLISEDDLRNMLSVWLENCPSVLINDEKTALDPVISRRIGKKRTVVISAGLSAILSA